MSFTLEATIRTQHGKGAARRARAAEKTPGILYAPGKAAVSVTVSPKELTKAMLSGHRRNTLIELKLKDEAGKEQGSRFALVKELQVHHIRRTPLHVDFVEVTKGKPVVVSVPLELTGKSKASVQGALTQLCVRSMKVSVNPEAIPEKIVIDTTECDFGVVRAKAVPLPTGLTLADAPEAPILSLAMPRGEKEEAAAAPAAGAAAAAAPAADAKKEAPKK